MSGEDIKEYTVEDIAAPPSTGNESVDDVQNEDQVEQVVVEFSDGEEVFAEASFSIDEWESLIVESEERNISPEVLAFERFIEKNYGEPSLFVNDDDSGEAEVIDGEVVEDDE